jgi:hypothetical protein
LSLLLDISQVHGLTLGCLPTAKTKEKTRNLHLNKIYDKILGDCKTGTNKGYYITGQLNPTIYRDDKMMSQIQTCLSEDGGNV